MRVVDDLSLFRVDFDLGGGVADVKYWEAAAAGDITAYADAYANGASYLVSAVGGSSNLNVASKTGNYTATDTDDVILCDASGGGFTISLPTAAGRSGKVFYVKKTDTSSNLVTIDPNGAQTLDGLTTRTIAIQYSVVVAVSDGTNWRLL